MSEQYGGQLVAQVLARHGVKFLYTLCGGHISPILVAAEQQGVRVVDVRDEATAVFAADATARLTGVVGVAAVTAGPGVTNTITAVKNAQMAQSPVLILGGAAATLMQGRGALQDIDQISLVKPLVKMAAAARRVRDIVPTLEQAMRIAQEGVPGPVFVEIPVDLLYQESTVRQLMLNEAGRAKGIMGVAMKLYLGRHLRKTFGKAWTRQASDPAPIVPPLPTDKQVAQVMGALAKAKRPLLIVGSQAMLDAGRVDALQQALIKLGIPTYLSGMARGLLGHNPLHLRQQRGKALREADTIILAGVPCDFRLGYGRSIPRRANYISINRSQQDLTKNRRPTIGVLADPGTFLRMVAANWSHTPDWTSWRDTLQARDAAREMEIQRHAAATTEFINPIWLCQKLEEVIDDDSVLVGDGGDFVATASYIVRPRSPLSWLDPGAFGTLGPGGGFALAAKLCRPLSEVWLLYGDGSAGYSLAEFDTFTRHGVPVIAIIGNDASWSQIAREQVVILGSSLGTDLARSNYHIVAEGYGGVGLCVDDPAQVKEVLQQAKEIARNGRSVLINAMIGRTEFRKGSISM